MKQWLREKGIQQSQERPGNRQPEKQREERWSGHGALITRPRSLGVSLWVGNREGRRDRMEGEAAGRWLVEAAVNKFLLLGSQAAGGQPCTENRQLDALSQLICSRAKFQPSRHRH